MNSTRKATNVTKPAHMQTGVVAKDHRAWDRYRIRHRLDSRDFYFVASTRVLEHKASPRIIVIEGADQSLNYDDLMEAASAVNATLVHVGTQEPPPQTPVEAAEALLGRSEAL